MSVTMNRSGLSLASSSGTVLVLLWKLHIRVKLLVVLHHLLLIHLQEPLNRLAEAFLTGPARHCQIDLRSTTGSLNLLRPTLVQAHHGKELHMLIVVIDLVQKTLQRLNEKLQMTLDMGVVERIMHTLIIIINMVVWLAENQNHFPSYTLGMKLSIRPLITGLGLSRFLTVELATRWGYITAHKEVLNAILWALNTMLMLILDKVYINQQHAQTTEIIRPKTVVLGPHWANLHIRVHWTEICPPDMVTKTMLTSLMLKNFVKLP